MTDYFRRALLLPLFFAVLIAAVAVRAPLAQTTPPKDSGLLAAPVVAPIRGMTWPTLSPDGKQICFVYKGDLWTVPTDGGRARRLTINEAYDSYPRWSPDGKFIAFSSLRTGNADIFLVPGEGGEARQVTYNSGNDWVTDWSAHGNKLLFYANGRDTKSFALFSIDLHTRRLDLLSHDDEDLRFAVYSPDGTHVAATRGGMPWFRPWYRGSQAASTIVEDLKTGDVTVPLKSNVQQFWPLYSPDGKDLYMSTILGASNTPNLCRVPVAGGAPRAITHYTTDAVRWPCISHDGSLMAYVWNGDLYTIKPDGAGSRKITIYAPSDEKVNNQTLQVLTSGADDSELSPDGKTLALVLKGNIWTIPITGGDAVRLTNNNADNEDIAWSPDSTHIVYVSDVSSEPDIYTVDVKTHNVLRITSNPSAKSDTHWSPDGRWISFAQAGSQPGLYVTPAAGGEERRLAPGNGNNNFGTGITSHTWSPDSRWLAFSRMDRYKVNDIWLVPVVGGTPVNITQYPGVNVDPQFTKDGRELLFLSGRNGGQQLFHLPLQGPGAKAPPNPREVSVAVDFDDITNRALPVPGLPMGVDDYAPSPDSHHVVAQNGSSFWGATIDGGGAFQITAEGEGGGNIQFLPNGSRFFYLGANGVPRSLGLPPSPPGPPVAVSYTANWTFDRKLLYQQAFEEFYRRFGASFYDPTMNGVDWAALRKKYQPLLPSVGTPIEFSFLLSEMVGEVNSSHSEIAPSDTPSGPQTATLGLNYDYSYPGPGLKVLSVMPKGPADQPTAHVYAGDYVLSVDGTDVTMNEDYYQALQEKAGKKVTLVVNDKPTKTGARTVTVTPMPEPAWERLYYLATVQKRRELVDHLSNGRLAYIHIEAMDPASLKQFDRDLYSTAIRKDGLILDIRGNGGGNTHDAILQALAQRVYAYTQPRDGVVETDPTRAFLRPVVLLINQNSYSDAEIFPAAFRSLHIGKIVGMTTPGYVIGTYDVKLLDGTTIRLPSWAFYTSDGRNMENLGIKPDVLVENTPDDIAHGRDPQLEVAVETALKELPAPSETAKNAAGKKLQFLPAIDNPNGASSAVPPPADRKR